MAQRRARRSPARRTLSELTETLGKDGILIVPKRGDAPRGPSMSVAADDPGDAWEDVVPGKALRWPKCRCGSPKCPDYDASPSKVADRNGYSSRSGT
jgi:hypothetical protein